MAALAVYAASSGEFPPRAGTLTNSPLDVALSKVEVFLQDLQAHLTPGTSKHTEGKWLSRQGEGSLFLDAAESRSYSALVVELVKAAAPREDFSRASIERLVNDALFTALDLQGRSNALADDRVHSAITDLRLGLQTPTEVFRCWMPIGGIDLDRRDAWFGGMAFVKFGPQNLGQISRHRTKDSRDKSWQGVLHLVRRSKTWGATCAVVRLARSEPKPKTVASLVVTAAQWAGRATVDRRREQQFLLYAIALETLMLPTKEAQGLSYRLRLRTAHLLGRTRVAREEIASEVGGLYDVRSRIVHSGSYEVSEQDLASIRAIAKRAVVRMLVTPKLHGLTDKQFGVWLDRRLL